MADLSSVLGGSSPFIILNVNKQSYQLGKYLPYSVDEVYELFIRAGIPKDDAKILQRQDVDGESLPSLTDDNLLKMGIPTFGRRNKILRLVNEWVMEAAASGGAMGMNRSSLPITPSRKLLTGGGGGGGGMDDRYYDRRDDYDNNNRDRLERERLERLRVSNDRGGLRDDDYFNRSSDRDRRTDLNISNNNLSKNVLDDNEPSYQPSYGGTDDDYDSDLDREVVNPRQERFKELVASSGLRGSGMGGGGGLDDDLFGTMEVKLEQFAATRPWLGAIVAPSIPIKNNPSPPDQRLRIDWIHGYRAFDSHSNLVYNALGDIIYPVAGVVVVYKAKTKRQQHFLGHGDDVRCLAQDPTNPNRIVSGQNATIIEGRGNPPHICVWDSTDFSKCIKLKMTQADRAVRSVCFSSDGRLVVSVSNDDNHSIKVWDWEKAAVVGSAKGDNNEILQVKWNHKDNQEFVTVGKRHVAFWNWDGRKLTGKRGQLGTKDRGLTFYCVAFSEKGFACVGAQDGSIFVFSGGKVAKVFTGVHSGKVLSLDWYAGGLVSGGADKIVHILDKKMEVAKSFTFANKIKSVHIRSNNLLVGTQGSEVFEIVNFPSTEVEDDSKLDPITQGHFDGELWGLSVAPDNRHYVTVGEDNTLCIWDIDSKKMVRRGILNEKAARMPKVRKASTVSTHPPNQCARAVAISPNGKHIITGLNDGTIAVYNAANLQRIATQDLNRYGKRQVTNQTQNWIQVIQYSPSGHTVAVGTHGSVICLLDVTDGYKVKGALTGHNSFLTHIDWSEDGTNMRSTCGAYELLFWNIDESDLKRSSQNTSAKALRDVKWYTETTVFGWAVQGIFQPGQDGTDVNTCDVSASRRLIVTGDDSGKVNLFRYPCEKKTNKFNVADGHSSHVCSTRFTPNEKYIISAGGHDLAIIQWAIV